MLSSVVEMSLISDELGGFSYPSLVLKGKTRVQRDAGQRSVNSASAQSSVQLSSYPLYLELLSIKVPPSPLSSLAPHAVRDNDNSRIIQKKV